MHSMHLTNNPGLDCSAGSVVSGFVLIVLTMHSVKDRQGIVDQRIWIGGIRE